METLENNRCVARAVTGSRTKAGAVLVASLLCAAMAGGARAVPQPSIDAIGGQSSEARDICQRTIQVHPGEDRFNDCLSSLSASLNRASANRMVAAARDSCFETLHSRSAAELNTCLLAAADEKVEFKKAQPQPIGSPAAENDTENPDAFASFYALPSDAKIQRERRACALAGFDPALGAFSRCVSDLEDALQTQPLD